jgi:hypothetical protein
MALPGNTQTNYDTVGNREDLSDIIYDISPTETPFCSGIARNKATAVTHEWQTDSLAAADTANAQLEGDDASGNAVSATTRLNNVCQILDKVVIVSGTQRAVTSAGRADELEYQVAKRGRELKRDIEAIVLSEHGKVAGSTATARNMAGIESWLSTNKVHNATTSTTPGGGTAIVEGNAVAVTAALLKSQLDTVIQQCWTAGGDPTVIMVPGAGKVTASQMTGIATLYRDVPAKSQGQIIGGADVYVSNFGNHTIVPNRFMRTKTALVLDMEFWAISELRGMMVEKLAKTGDNDKRQLLTEITLEARNEASSGKVADITYS